jgi:hypothetical protein
MKYTPRQIVVRAREAAYLLLVALDHDAMVKRFLEGYAKEHDRAGVITQPPLFRDLMGSVRREAILEMATHIDDVAPRKLGIVLQTQDSARAKSARKKTSRGVKEKRAVRDVAQKRALPAGATATRLRTAELQVLNLFREQFFAALSQALRWTPDDLAEFSRDYDLYQTIAARVGDVQTPRGAKGAVTGPFVDRCGLLVDPSMLEQARRAAGKFQAQLDATAEGVLKKAFAKRREN